MKRLGAALLRLILAFCLWFVVVVFFQAAELPISELTPELRIDKQAIVGMGVVVGAPIALVYLLLPLFRRRQAAGAQSASAPRRRFAWLVVRIIGAWLLISVLGGLGTGAMLAVEHLLLGQPQVCESVRYGALAIIALVAGFVLAAPMLARHLPRKAVVAIIPVGLLSWAGITWLVYDSQGDLLRQFEAAIRADAAAASSAPASPVDLSLRFRPGQRFGTVINGEVIEVGSRGGCGRSFGRVVTRIEETSQFVVRRVARDGTANVEWRVTGSRMTQSVDGKTTLEFDTADRASMQRAADQGQFEPAILDALIDLVWVPTGEVQIVAVRNLPPATADIVRRLIENRRYFERGAFPAKPVQAGETWSAGQITSLAMKISGKYTYRQSGVLRGVGDEGRSAYLHYFSTGGQSVDDPDRPVTGRVETARNEGWMVFAIDRGLPARFVGNTWTRARLLERGRSDIRVEVRARTTVEWR